MKRQDTAGQENSGSKAPSRGGTKEKKSYKNKHSENLPMSSGLSQAPSSPREVPPALVTCVTQDPSIGVEGHRELPGVGDLHDVRVDVTENDVAKVQDILGQLSSGRRSKESP